MFIGVPIAISLGLSGTLSILFSSQDSIRSLVVKLFETSEHCTLLAIPFFFTFWCIHDQRWRRQAFDRLCQFQCWAHPWRACDCRRHGLYVICCTIRFVTSNRCRRWVNCNCRYGTLQATQKSLAQASCVMLRTLGI